MSELNGYIENSEFPSINNSTISSEKFDYPTDPVAAAILPARSIAFEDAFNFLINDDESRKKLSDARKSISRLEVISKESPIKKARLALGMSQTDLAYAMGTSQSHVARLEAHDADPRISTIRKAANALGMPTTAIIELIGNGSDD